VKPTKRITRYIASCSLVLLIVACGNPMQPAKNALDNINATLTAASADAQKYIPDQLADAQGKVAQLTAAYNKQDYAAVVAGAPAVLAQVSGLATAASEKRDEMLKAMGKEWRSLAVAIPQSMTAVQTRIDALSKTHAPKGVDLAAAKSGLADAKSSWDAAQEAFKSGNAPDGVTAAKDSMSKLQTAAAALKLTLPTGP
jgi:hypothetical protein